MHARLNLLALLIVVVAAIGLRAWAFPARYEVRGVDELPYTQGSLELLEGMTPAYKYAPAGPQTWMGWAYAGSLATKYAIRPTAEERAVPMEVRPFVAVNHALFDLYRDISGLRRFVVVISVVLSVLAVAAAFAVGVRAGGVPGGVLLGGLFAVAPLMIDYAEQARSFSMAWSFIMIAVYFAACRTGKTALWGSAIFLGLSIAQRIDMLVLMPIVWIEYWYTLRELPVTRRKVLGDLVAHAGIGLVTTLLVAPWLLTNIIGNLRTIATVRFSVPPGGPIPWTIPLFEFSWTEGLAIVAVLFVAGSLWGLFRRQLRRPVLCVYVLLLLPGILKSTGHEISHQAAAVLALFIAAPLAVAALSTSTRVLWAMVLLAVLLPLGMAMKEIYVQRKAYVPDQATAWVESHVPSGTSLVINPDFHNPLPTPQSADALWQEEMNNDAARKKFQAGLARFHLGDLDMPRALSEENMIVERVERRGWYILGSRSWLPDRRYDIHIYGQSMVFGSTDPMPAFSKNGGVLIWRGGPVAGLTNPLMKWIDDQGVGTYIYCADDIRSRITP